jgi:hypothetical protein
MCVTKIISVNKYVPILIYINTHLRGRERERGREVLYGVLGRKKAIQKGNKFFFWRAMLACSYKSKILPTNL